MIRAAPRSSSAHTVVAHSAGIGYKDDGLTNPKALWYFVIAPATTRWPLGYDRRRLASN
jgi:hypothetical protein